MCWRGREDWSQERARKLHHGFISHVAGPVATANLDEAGKVVELCALANTMEREETSLPFSF